MVMLAVVFSALLVMPGVSYAQTGGPADDVTTQNEASEDTPSGTDRASGRQDRIDKYKEKVTEKLSAAKERRITNGCKAAQGKVTSLQNNLSRAITNRKDIYTNIKERLDAVVVKLQAASIDTAELEVAIADIETQSSAVMEKIETYKATLEDLAAMDCTVDPTGFAAALSAAREQRTEIVTMAQALKSFVQDDVKAILQTIRQDLASNNEEAEPASES